MAGILRTLAVFAVMLAASVAWAACPKATNTAQEQVARSEIQSRIDQTIEADEAKDLDAKLHYAAADMTVRLEDGTELGRKQIEEGLRRDADWILSVSDRTHTEVECIELKGRTALVLTRQHFVRMVPDRKDGSPHELVTNVTHRETWVYGERGWVTKHIEELAHGPMLLDGEPFEP
jgi:hypothetical protein